VQRIGFNVPTPSTVHHVTHRRGLHVLRGPLRVVTRTAAVAYAYPRAAPGIRDSARSLYLSPPRVPLSPTVYNVERVQPNRQLRMSPDKPPRAVCAELGREHRLRFTGGVVE
jgi:hypothetical protein